MKKFEVDRKELLKAIRTAMRAQRKGRNVPDIEQHLLLEQHDNKITLTGFSPDLHIRSVCPAYVVDPASYHASAVNAKQLLAMVRGGSEDVISFSVKQGKLYAIGGIWELMLDTMPADEFPSLPIDGESLTPLRVAEQALAAAVKQTIPCMAKDERTRPVLNGLHLWNKQEGSLHITAMDGIRIAATYIDISSFKDQELSAIIPHVAAKHLDKILMAKSRSDVDITTSDEWVSIITPSAQVVCKSITGAESYPDIERYLGALGDAPLSLTLKRKQLIDIVQQSYAVSDRGSKKDAIMALTISESNITIQSVNVGKVLNVSKILVPYANIKGIYDVDEELGIMLKPYALLPMLKALRTEEVTLELAGTFKPIMIKAGGDNAYRALLMPCRTN